MTWVYSINQQVTCEILVTCWCWSLMSMSFTEYYHFLTCVSHTAHVIAIGCMEVCPSVRPSHAGIVSNFETAKPIVKLTSLPGSPMIPVF